MTPGTLTSSSAADGMAHDPVQELIGYCEETCRLLSVAQTLVHSSRSIDLDGIQGRVGLACAKALDLSASRTGLVKLELERLLHAIGALEAALRERGE